MSQLPLLAVEDLYIRFATPVGWVRAVNGVAFSMESGQTLGIVGESGSGKSVMARAIMNILPHRGTVHEGRVLLSGRNMFDVRSGELRQVLGKEVALIPQQPMAALNPVLSIGQQLSESLKLHLSMSDRAARSESLELLSSVRIPEPQRRLDEYPHQLSGGMCQRVMIAMALAARPKLLIADEPTTALDVTIQAQILELLKEQQEVRGMALILITHDMGVAAMCSDRIAVMYAGRFLETAPTRQIFREYRSPYTEALLTAVPRLDRPVHSRLDAIPGQPPDPARLPTGCSFHPRCAYAMPTCRTDPPPFAPTPDGADHHVACWNPVHPGMKAKSAVTT
jgi:peptide/nickel transport system ATP-binding protein